MKNRILVADVPQADARYAAALGGMEIVFARTMAEAHLALARGCALALIGVHFDDSQMFELLRTIRADPVRARLPVVCVRSHTEFTAVSSRTLETTLKALGADEFIDLPHYGSDDAAGAALRSLATSCAARTSGGTL
jgi:CheY-like chemotaxis protein